MRYHSLPPKFRNTLALAVLLMFAVAMLKQCFSG